MAEAMALRSLCVVFFHRRLAISAPIDRGGAAGGGEGCFFAGLRLVPIVYAAMIACGRTYVNGDVFTVQQLFDPLSVWI